MQYFRTIILLTAVVWSCTAYSAHAAVLLKVPFTSQAPSGDWRQPFQDFCEEASVVMAAHFLWGVGLTPEIAELEMKIIKRYEDLVFGKSKDTSIDETASILRMLYRFKQTQTLVIDSATEIKDELRQGRIVIVPAAGRLLKNPYFTPPGPFITCS